MSEGAFTSPKQASSPNFFERLDKIPSPPNQTTVHTEPVVLARREIQHSRSCMERSAPIPWHTIGIVNETTREPELSDWTDVSPELYKSRTTLHKKTRARLKIPSLPKCVVWIPCIDQHADKI